MRFAYLVGMRVGYIRITPTHHRDTQQVVRAYKTDVFARNSSESRIPTRRTSASCAFTTQFGWWLSSYLLVEDQQPDNHYVLRSHVPGFIYYLHFAVRAIRNGEKTRMAKGEHTHTLRRAVDFSRRTMIFLVQLYGQFFFVKRLLT